MLADIAEELENGPDFSINTPAAAKADVTTNSKKLDEARVTEGMNARVNQDSANLPGGALRSPQELQAQLDELPDRIDVDHRDCMPPV